MGDFNYRPDCHTLDRKVADPNKLPAKVPRPKDSVFKNRELKKRRLNDYRIGKKIYMRISSPGAAIRDLLEVSDLIE
jgi:hypothetical protein